MHKKGTVKKNAKGHIIWDDSYSVEVPLLDAHHKRMIEMINVLINDPHASYTSVKIADLLSEAMRSAIEHFKAEEDYMAAIGYPGLEVHKKEHKKFIVKIAEESMLAMQKKEGATDLLHFFKAWLVHHVLHTDQQYKIYQATHVSPCAPRNVHPSSLDMYFKE